jgi:hypothetical protein
VSTRFTSFLPADFLFIPHSDHFVQMRRVGGMSRARAGHSDTARDGARHSRELHRRRNAMHGRNRVRQLACCTLTIMATLALGCATAPPARTETSAIHELRADYRKEFPDSPRNQHVLRGEVVRGMTLYEVLASWGVPDRRIVSDAGKERWVYVLMDDLSMDWVVYEYNFHDNTLVDWTTTRGAANGFALDTPEQRVSAMSLPAWAAESQRGGAPTR